MVSGQKARFLAGVYALLVAQLLATWAIQRTDFAKNVSAKVPIVLVVAVLFGLAFFNFRTLPTPVQLAVLAGYTVFMAIVLRKLADRTTEETVRTALMGAVGIFVAMAALGGTLAATGIDIGAWGVFLFAATVAVLLGGLLTMLAKDRAKVRRWVVIASLVVFSLWTAFDTNQILQRNYGGGIIEAALDFYTDFTAVFSDLIQSQS